MTPAQRRERQMMRDTILRERRMIYQEVQRALDYPEEFPGIEENQLIMGKVVGTLRTVLQRRDETTLIVEPE